jgi:undecaprenyl-diphosphatase
MGLVQGLTEFLPISSSAHLRVLGELLPSARDPGAAFTAIIQIGTELAVLIYFRRDIWRIARSWFASLGGAPRDQDAKLGWLIVIGSAPIAALGFAFRHQIETSARHLALIGTMLVVFGGLLWAADVYATRVARHRPPKQLADLSWTDGVIYGLAQALALVPGVSRSGGTITAGLFLGYSRAAAARYSFLLAMPAVFGAGALELVSALRGGAELGPGPTATVAAGVTALVVGYAVIVVFLKIVSTYSYKPFAVYRLVAGAAVIALALHLA